MKLQRCCHPAATCLTLLTLLGLAFAQNNARTTVHIYSPKPTNPDSIPVGALTNLLASHLPDGFTLSSSHLQPSTLLTSTTPPAAYILTPQADGDLPYAITEGLTERRSPAASALRSYIARGGTLVLLGASHLQPSARLLPTLLGTDPGCSLLPPSLPHPISLLQAASPPPTTTSASPTTPFLLPHVPDLDSLTIPARSAAVRLLSCAASGPLSVPWFAALLPSTDDDDSNGNGGAAQTTAAGAHVWGLGRGRIVWLGVGFGGGGMAAQEAEAEEGWAAVLLAAVTAAAPLPAAGVRSYAAAEELAGGATARLSAAAAATARRELGYWRLKRRSPSPSPRPPSPPPSPPPPSPPPPPPSPPSPSPPPAPPPSPSPPPAPPPPPPKGVGLGCFTSTRASPVRAAAYLLDAKKPDFNPAACAATARRVGYPYIGLNTSNAANPRVTTCYGLLVLPTTAPKALTGCGTCGHPDWTGYRCGDTNAMSVYDVAEFEDFDFAPPPIDAAPPPYDAAPPPYGDPQPPYDAAPPPWDSVPPPGWEYVLDPPSAPAPPEQEPAPPPAYGNQPTSVPTPAYGGVPTYGSEQPTRVPTYGTETPSAVPTAAPTAMPTAAPTDAPTGAPSAAPSAAPESEMPTEAPQGTATDMPLDVGTDVPLDLLTESPM